MKRLTRSERNGLVWLAVLSLGITGAGVFMSRCNRAGSELSSVCVDVHDGAARPSDEGGNEWNGSPDGCGPDGAVDEVSGRAGKGVLEGVGNKRRAVPVRKLPSMRKPLDEEVEIGD